VSALAQVNPPDITDDQRVTASMVPVPIPGVDMIAGPGDVVVAGAGEHDLEQLQLAGG
jgi:hypothetical protein